MSDSFVSNAVRSASFQQEESHELDDLGHGNATLCNLEGGYDASTVSDSLFICQWRLAIETGPAYRGNMKARVSGPSKAAAAGMQAARTVKGKVPNLSAAKATEAGVFDPPPYNPATGMKFDDGTVGPEIPGTFTAPVTGGEYWAADAEYLFKLAVPDSGIADGSSVRRSVESDGGEMSFDRRTLDGAGIRIDALYRLSETREMFTDLLLGFRGYWGMDKTIRGQGYRQTVRETTTRWSGGSGMNYSYWFYEGCEPEIGDDPSPGDPGGSYGATSTGSGGSGSPDAGSGYIFTGYVDVHGEPYGGGDARITGSKTTTWTALSDARIGIEAALYQFVVGGRIGQTVAEGVELSIRPAVTFNIIDLELTRDEVFQSDKGQLATWRDSRDKSSLRLGAALEFGATFALGGNWHVDLSGGYEVVDKLSADVGTNRVKLDLSGFTTTAALGWEF